MAVIETRYSVGDAVYHAGTTTERRQHPCPDCKGERKWTATSPAGSEYTFRCPRCAASYTSHNELNLNYEAHIPLVSKLTIGSVQYNSAAGSWDSGARYMCVETGVGGGRVYDEADLYSTHDEALTASAAKAEKANSSIAHVVERFNRTLEISDYQIENALLLRARQEVSKAGQLLWNVNDLFDTINEADGKDAILEAIDDYKSYSWQGDIKSLTELVDTIRAEAA